MNKQLYYILSFTWGIIMTFIGLISALCLTCIGRKANTYNGCLHFKVGKNWGGVSLGIVIITDDEPTEQVLKHEYGHTIQNAMYGILFPFIVAIPSALRYQKRRLLKTKGAEPQPYDAVWYEGQATAFGNKFIGG